MTTENFKQPDDSFSASEYSSGERLALLVHLSQAFNSSLDLDEVLNRVMDEVIAATRAERGFVVLVDDAGKVSFNVARGMDQQTIEDPQFQISRSVVERVTREGKHILTSDAQADSRFNIRQSVLYLKLRAILCVPISIKGKIIGAIYVDNRMQAGIFTIGDIELLNAIASSAAIAIENARLYKVAIEQGRLERELQMARKVQSGLLPQEIPEVPGWQFASLWKPARQVGGDYYDFIQQRQGKLALLIADVTDKGMPAALFMASTRSIMRAIAPLASVPCEAMEHANQLISQESGQGLFVSMFYCQLDPQTGELTYVNAGHNPPLICRADGSMSMLGVSGMPLGVDGDNKYGQDTVKLEPGEFILLYTDGVTDAQGSDEIEFGLDRLNDAITHNCSLPAGDILTAIQRAIDEFTGEVAPIDDITLLVAKRL